MREHLPAASFFHSRVQLEVETQQQRHLGSQELRTRHTMRTEAAGPAVVSFPTSRALQLNTHL